MFLKTHFYSPKTHFYSPA